MQHVEHTIGAPATATRPPARPAVRPGGDPAPSAGLLETAVRYAQERHWDVLPGTWLEDVDGGRRCSCGDPACPAPGAHPTRPDWPGQATGSGAAVRRMWAREPRASILLPTGRGFDAIDVPEVAGCLALARMERMDLPLGPVLCTPTRRLVFLVLPGATAKVPDLLRRLGWPPASLDLVVRGDGDYVAAPPTRMSGTGHVQWARHPGAVNRWLPDAEELLSPLAYACGREAAAQRGR
ncbi:bifunctional DNA primase/polymerase [Streptantibioticus parmotrematis]|uniref:bifunctional DNA primase/polymerase n=1 Tax=Streptantibioticus parmotrematis TaxID=2873249 RepID=UPI003F4CC37D